MISINRQEILENLEELSDIAIQKKLWLSSAGQVSSLDEAISQLFDDSGLDKALEKGEVFGTDIDKLLISISVLYRQVDQTRSRDEVINEDSALKKIREAARLATEKLKMMN